MPALQEPTVQHGKQTKSHSTTTNRANGYEGEHRLLREYNEENTFRFEEWVVLETIFPRI